MQYRPDTYGMPTEYSPLEREALAYINNLPVERGGLGRLTHFKRFIHMIWPDTEWNPWLEKFVEAFVYEDWTCMSGCASSGKTHGSALCATAWWLCAADVSSVILTSTTKAMIRKRAWGVVQNLYRTMSIGAFGNMVDSKTTWQSQKGDDKHAMFGVAVEEGSVTKAIDHIKGIHTRRQLVVVDEATSVPEAVFEACANLYAGAQEFKLVVMGNPRSRLDVMGQFMEPESGWSSVTVDSDGWRTIKQLHGRAGMCVRFDAEKSPNLIEGKTRWPYLVTEGRLRNAERRLGASSPEFYTEYRGFPPSEGTIKTVFTEGLLTQNHGMRNEHEFTGEWWIDVAGFDPAFGGGDRPQLRFARFGKNDKGDTVMNLRDKVTLEIDADSVAEEPVHYQLARQCEDECKQRNVKPGMCAVDATGEGGGLCDIITRNWGQIIRVEFGGAAGDAPINAEDPRPANEVYANKVAEMWFAAREFLISGQLRGFDSETAIEFCQREYLDRATDGRSIRIKLESKKDYKAKHGQSPDLADAAAMAIEAGRAAGMTLKSIGVTTSDRDGEWDKYIRESDKVFADPTEGLY
ncbi:MAG: hypothetical protein ACE5HE_00210 [Phycisphaerae bacterium]